MTVDYSFTYFQLMDPIVAFLIQFAAGAVTVLAVIFALMYLNSTNLLTPSKQATPNTQKPDHNPSEEYTSSEDEEDEEDEDIRYKMVLVIRSDLEMSKGKVAAQCCHACLAAYKITKAVNPEALKLWAKSGQAKVTLKCADEAEMLKLQRAAEQTTTLDTKRPLTAISIQDAGRTQIAAGSRTVLAIGPALDSDINRITGGLKLY